MNASMIAGMIDGIGLQCRRDSISNKFGFLDYSISNNTSNNSKKTISQDHVNGLV